MRTLNRRRARFNNPLRETFSKILGTILLICFFITAWIIMTGGGFGNRKAEKFNYGRPLVFAHKGMQNYYAENSQEGFNKSGEIGFNAIETDIMETKDKRLIVFHDRTAGKMLGINQPTAELNFKDIKNKKLNHRNIPSQNEIITLKEMIQLYNTKFIIYLDMKDVSRNIADSILHYLEMYDAYNTIVVGDRNVLFLAYLKYREPKVKTVLEGFYGHRVWFHYLIPKNFKPDYYANFLYEVTNEHVDFIKNADLLDNEIVYGVDSSNIQDVYRYGFKNIIVDYDSSMNVRDLHNNLSVHRTRTLSY